MALRGMMAVLAASLLVWGVTGSAHAFGETRYSIPLEDSPSIGPQAAPVVLVEFIDYQ